MTSAEDKVREVIKNEIRGNKSVSNTINAITDKQCKMSAMKDTMNDITSYIKHKLELTHSQPDDVPKIQQYLNGWIAENKPDTQKKDQSGGRKHKTSQSKSSKDYVYVLGRNRKITKVGVKSIISWTLSKRRIDWTYPSLRF